MSRTLLALILFTVGQALAAAELEVITLRNRSADQVIEVLRPLLEAGGSISGMNDKLFVRASAENRAQIRQALAAIDTAPRRLMITVRQDNQAEGGSAGARVWSTRGSAADRGSQQVQVVEGGRALIEVGSSFPVPLQEFAIGPPGAAVSRSVVYRDIGSGFYAQPRLSGDWVTLEISPRQESLSDVQPGVVHSARLATTVSGRLGEWIAIGGTNQEIAGERAGGVTYSTRSGLQVRRILLKVEELR
jgi:type II secretory pathway component GspD/PulD (secretin)